MEGHGAHERSPVDHARVDVQVVIAQFIGVEIDLLGARGIEIPAIDRAVGGQAEDVLEHVVVRMLQGAVLVADAAAHELAVHVVADQMTNETVVAALDPLGMQGHITGDNVVVKVPLHVVGGEPGIEAVVLLGGILGLNDLLTVFDALVGDLLGSAAVQVEAHGIGVLGPMGIQGEIGSDLVRVFAHVVSKAPCAAALGLGVPAVKRVALARRLLRLGHGVAIADRRGVNARAALRVERHLEGLTGPVGIERDVLGDGGIRKVELIARIIRGGIPAGKDVACARRGTGVLDARSIANIAYDRIGVADLRTVTVGPKRHRTILGNPLGIEVYVLVDGRTEVELGLEFLIGIPAAERVGLPVVLVVAIGELQVCSMFAVGHGIGANDVILVVVRHAVVRLARAPMSRKRGVLPEVRLGRSFRIIRDPPTVKSVLGSILVGLGHGGKLAQTTTLSNRNGGGSRVSTVGIKRDRHRRLPHNMDRQVVGNPLVKLIEKAPLIALDREIPIREHLCVVAPRRLSGLFDIRAVFDRLRRNRRAAMRVERHGELVALPLGVQGDIAGNGCLKVVRGRAVLIGIPAHKVISDGRRLLGGRHGIAVGNLDRRLLRDRHVRVERNGVLLLLELGPDLRGADLRAEVELLRAGAVGVPALKVIALAHRIGGLLHRATAIGVRNAEGDVGIAPLHGAHEQDGCVLGAAAKHREQRHVLGNRHIGVPNG